MSFGGGGFRAAKVGRAWVQDVRRLVIAAGLLLVVYVGSYAALYRRGVTEAERHGYDYFFYVPFTDVVAARDATARHQWLGPVYKPTQRTPHDMGMTLPGSRGLGPVYTPTQRTPPPLFRETYGMELRLQEPARRVIRSSPALRHRRGWRARRGSGRHRT